MTPNANGFTSLVTQRLDHTPRRAVIRLAFFSLHRTTNTTQHSHHTTPYTVKFQLTLVMSDPVLDLPEIAIYSFDPDIQCSAVKPGGKRCTARISCKTHGEAEKRAVNRSTTFEELLKRQTGCHDLKLRIFDPDVRCCVDLSTGERCMEDLLLCETHTCEQQSVVQGRSVCLDDLLRVNRANASRGREKSGSDPQKYNSDTDCGAFNADGEHCQGRLPCVIHGVKVKRTVSRRPPFSFDLLCHLQHWRICLYELDNAYQCKTAEQGNAGQSDLVLGESSESQQASDDEGCTGSDETDVQVDSNVAPPATPDRSSRGNTDTASPNQTPTAPSPKTSRGNVSLPSLMTSGSDQLTPTSSRDSLHDDISDEQYESTVAGSTADLNAHYAQLKRDWAQLHYDQARQELYKAQLQNDRYHLETQLLQDQAREDHHKAQLYDQDRETRRNEKLVFEQHLESRRNEQLVYDQHLENHRNEQVLHDQDKEIRHNALLVYEQDKEHRRKAQVLYEQDRAALDRRMREQQVTELEVTRLRTRAQRADELELTLNIRLSQKASMLQSLEQLRASLESRGSSYQKSQEDMMQGLQREMETPRIQHRRNETVRRAYIGVLREKINAID
ncbi:hypothetical protein Q7P36_004704 [Cladosporium allicinum]